jgi:hypothetical protein
MLHRQEVFDTRQQDVRERLRALEQRVDSHESNDVFRFENRSRKEGER